MKAALIAVAVFVIAAGVALTRGFVADDVPAPDVSPSVQVTVVPTSPGAVPTEALSQVPTDGPTSVDADTDAGDVAPPPAALAREVVEAYSTWSWRDPGPTAWVERVGDLGTDHFRQDLEQEFAGPNADQASWKETVVGPKASSRAVIGDVTLASYTKAAEATYEVSYTVQRKTLNPKTGWTDFYEATQAVRFELTADGRWLVSDVLAAGT